MANTQSARRGWFIALEGIDGSGKSTQAARLFERLRLLPGWHAELLREPGSTPLGERVRGLLKDSAEVPMSPPAELLLFAAARAQLVHQELRPALAAGVTVICDRFTASTVAYQGYGRGIDLDTVAAVNAAATGGLLPDVNVLLDIDVTTALQRRLAGPEPDRIEREARAFYERVAAGYEALAARSPDHWLVVDGRSDADQVAGELWSRLGPRLAIS